jgi:hypothetical protein
LIRGETPAGGIDDFVVTIEGGVGGKEVQAVVDTGFRGIFDFGFSIFDFNRRRG